MKSSSAYQLSTANDHLMTFKINESIMKKLANTSPFLLLLLPVFMMIILTLTMNTNNTNQNDTEMVSKPVKTSGSIVKQATAIFK